MAYEQRDFSRGDVILLLFLLTVMAFAMYAGLIAPTGGLLR